MEVCLIITDYSSTLIFRPERKLLCVNTSEDVDIVHQIYEGGTPYFFESYVSTYGSYDQVGLFFIGSDDINNSVVGIELYDTSDTPDDASFMIKELSENEMLKVEVDRAYFHSPQDIIDFVDSLRVHKPLLERKYEFDGRIVALFFEQTRIRVLISIHSDSDYVIIDKNNYDEASKEELFTDAYVDKVTGLYTWNWLSKRFRQNLLNKEGIKRFCFAHFDIKDFKMINREYTSYEADKILCMVADTLRTNPNIYYVVRCYNDNFAMLIKDMPDEDLNNLLESVFAELSVFESKRKIPVYYRVGVVRSRETLNAGVNVMSKAKLAQSMCRKINETEIRYYSDSLQDSYLWGRQVRSYLDTALDNDEFLVYYQPKYDVNTEKVVGAEALVRWMYKKREFLFPNSFIPYFEKDSSIYKLSDVILEKVCASMVELQNKGLSLVPISVNLSRKLMDYPFLADHLEEIVDRYEIEHKYIEFELTESATYEKTNYLLKVIEQLKDKGFTISMDDFGTGYSSFSLLMNMPIDTLKIDKMFVAKLGNNDNTVKEKIVVKNLISMCKELGFSCLAEGAETEEQVSELKALGIDVIQGYYYNKPMPMDEFKSLLY